MIIGCICYATEQGLGRLAKSFYDHGLITEMLIYQHPNANSVNHVSWYPPETPVLPPRKSFRVPIVEQFLKRIDILLCFETPFDWEVLKMCQEQSVKSVVIPMYEWMLEHPPYQFDLFLNPSLLDQDYFPNGQFIPIPVETKFWELRTRARRFLHNAGNIGSRCHKGTEELLKAIPLVKSPMEITIRSQHVRGLKSLIAKVPGLENDPRVTLGFGEIPYEDLWKDHDVLIAPEKYNGLSLPLQEARAAGMLVMASDRYPANTWLPTAPLIPVSHYQRAQTMHGHLGFDEAIIEPAAIAQKIDEWYDRDITAFSESGKTWAMENSWEVLKPKYLQALEAALCPT